MEGVNIFINGLTGSGKSFFAKHYIREYNRILIYDVQDEYDEGIPFDTLGELKKFWREHYAKDFRMIYKPVSLEDFSEVCELVFACGDMAFVVEELDSVASTHDHDPSFQSVLRRGRRRNIDFIGVTQRPYGINRTITSQIKIFFSFYQQEPRDIQYLKNYIGAEAEEIQSLDLARYEFLYKNFITGESKIQYLKNGDIYTTRTLTELRREVPEEPEEPEEPEPKGEEDERPKTMDMP